MTSFSKDVIGPVPLSSFSATAAAPSVRHMLRKGIHFLLLYALWKLFYLLEDCVLHPDLLAAEGFKKHVILAFFQLPGKYHLWYLPMLALLLLLVPLLYAGAQNKRACELYLALFLLFTIIPQTAFNFEFPFKYLLMDFRNLFDLSYFAGYLGYFILGHYLYTWVLATGEEGTAAQTIMKAGIHSQRTPSEQQRALAEGQRTPAEQPGAHTESQRTLPERQRAQAEVQTVLTGASVASEARPKHKRQRTSLSTLSACLLLAGILTWLLALAFAGRRSAQDGAAFYGFSTPFSIHCLLFSTAIFLYVCGGCGKDRKDKDQVPAFARAAFGIYLLHPFVLDVLKKTGIFPSVFWQQPILGIPILVLVLGGGSFLLTWLLLRLPGLRKLVS